MKNKYDLFDIGLTKTKKNKYDMRHLYGFTKLIDLVTISDDPTRIKNFYFRGPMSIIVVILYDFQAVWKTCPFIKLT